MKKYEPIFLTLTGSRLYGTARIDSDYDYRGIVLGNASTYIGELDKFENTRNVDEVNLTKHVHKRLKDPEIDVEFYEVGKFIKLAWDANPNIIEFLFANNIIIDESGIWDRIIEHREYFLSQKILHTFSGYAHAQMKRMKNHKRWMKEVKKPAREEFQLPTGNSVFSKSAIRAMKTLSKKELELLGNDILNREIAFFKQQKDYENYNTWKKNRNPYRFELESKYNYDSKFALHLVRLFYECEELLTTGKIEFPLKKREVLKDILFGKWTYDEVIEFAEDMDANLKNLKTDLPMKPNRKKLNQLIIDIRREVCGK